MIHKLYLGAALALVATTSFANTAKTGTTRIANWKDDKQAAFMMMFDDACPTHNTNVYPELQEREMTGTYYVIPGKGEFKAHQAFWEAEAPAAANVVYGNHTMTAKAFESEDHAREMIAGCNEVILNLFPGKEPRLISFAAPGGVKHATTKEQIEIILEENHLVLRPPFTDHGANIHFKTGAEILQAVDKAIGSGGAQYVIFHGVGGDWLSFDKEEFVTLLDGLEERRDTVWITDHISVHKYETSKKSTQVETKEASDKKIVLTVKSDTDREMFDQPLTLVTTVPSGWTSAKVTQNDHVITVPVANGEAMFDALPINSLIELEPAN